MLWRQGQGNVPAREELQQSLQVGRNPWFQSFSPRIWWLHQPKSGMMVIGDIVVIKTKKQHETSNQSGELSHQHGPTKMSKYISEHQSRMMPHDIAEQHQAIQQKEGNGKKPSGALSFFFVMRNPQKLSPAEPGFFRPDGGEFSSTNERVWRVESHGENDGKLSVSLDYWWFLCIAH